MSGPPGEGTAPPHRWRIAGVAISVVLVVTAVVLAFVGGSGGAGTSPSAPHFASVDDLTSLEETLGHPVYWAGERPPARVELKEEAEGSVYLRYLPPGVEAGDPRQVYLTVGTYPVPDAVAALKRASAQSGVPLQHLADGGVVLPNSASEGSVYLAYPNSDLEVEVYDPTPGRSLRLIRAGTIGTVS